MELIYLLTIIYQFNTCLFLFTLKRLYNSLKSLQLSAGFEIFLHELVFLSVNCREFHAILCDLLLQPLAFDILFCRLSVFESKDVLEVFFRLSDLS